MKQGRLYIRFVEVLLLVLIIIYLAYSVFSAVYDPLTTTTVVEYEAGEIRQTDGYIVREEQTVTSDYPINVMLCAEGEKVSAGQTVISAYSDSSAQDRQSEITSLQEQLDELQDAVDTQLAASDTAEVDTEIYTALVELAQSVSQGRLSEARTQAGTAKALLLQRDIAMGDSTTAEITQRIAEISAQINDLQQQAGSSSKDLTVPQAGWFSGSADGYESVLTAEMLENITVADYEAISPNSLSDAVCGKLITSFTWYYVTELEADQAERLTEGSRIGVRLDSGISEQLRMKVEYISTEQDGKRVVVLSSDSYIQDMTQVRQIGAELIFSEWSGLCVPKEAVRYVDGETGVYVLDGAEAVWKPIEVLYDSGDSYVVTQDKSNVSNLWAGDELIVGARDLYDGKVVN